MGEASTSPQTGLLLSGGIDSAVLLNQLLENGQQVVPFYIRTGCVWQPEELTAAKKFLAQVEQPNLLDLVEFEVPLKDVYGNHWSITGGNVPDDHTTDEAVYLPGRNPLLLIKPALWCHTHSIPRLALATLASNPFSDATPEFFSRFAAMLHSALGDKLEIIRPFEQLKKTQVLALGCELPLELTFSCLAPIDRMHCGHCNKCAERQRGFDEIGQADRTQYASQPAISAATRASLGRPSIR